MVNVGIVGAGANKFTLKTEERAKQIIFDVLVYKDFPVTLVSGHSPMGGVDIWAEEIADAHHIPKLIHAPAVSSGTKRYGT